MASRAADDVEPKFEKVLEGLQGAEGPVFDKNGNFFMVAPDTGEIYNVNLQEKRAILLCKPKIEDAGVPAGCQCDKEGNIYVADMRLGILKVTQSGYFTQLAKIDNEGRIMQGCNDCIFDYEGNLWITAPAGEIAPSQYRRSMEEPFGSLYCLTNEEVIRIDTGIFFPNGIAVKHNASGKAEMLIVAETPTKLLWAYDIDGPGRVKNKRKWATLPGELEGGADGMDFDDAGSLLVAHWGSGVIEVFPPEGGTPTRRIKCPFQHPSNLHFKPNSNIVYVTEHDFHGLWKFDWLTCGQKQFCET
ncbi:diisopropyl-fluorophosphatase-like isoform X2 [Pomacea canaliculata]|nr:diisopropyl-fluorophosphatase-like isoform X2 [Pomacea canaliculata]XP_025081200.1 diisopropyl-fluorophosphatase-like isoform X2 [Pomacea canaliculata]